MWTGGLYTDDTNANTNSDTNPDNDGQSMIVQALWLINQMSQKNYDTIGTKESRLIVNKIILFLLSNPELKVFPKAREFFILTRNIMHE